MRICKGAFFVWLNLIGECYMDNRICRPIMLYNDFLPPEKKLHSSWQYLAFGYFDGISIGDNLFKDNSNSFEKIWKWDVQQTKELKEKYSVQMIYGFRDENDSYEELFWEEAKKEETEYPFLFIILLQGQIQENKQFSEYRIELERNLNCVNKRKAITYSTLDNCNLVLVLLCKDYGDGAEVIDGFHRALSRSPLTKAGIILRYSFSIASIQKKYLNSNRVEEKKDKITDLVFIYAIEKHPGSIKNVYNILAEQLEKENKPDKKSILGCNDEVIILKNISWSAFLKLFKSNTGIFNHSSDCYNKYLTAVTTIIAQNQGRLQENNSENQEELRDKGNKNQNQVNAKEEKTDKQNSINFSEKMLSVSLRDLMEKIIEEKPRSQDIYNNLEHYLYRVVHALQKFEETPLEDYIFCSMFLPIHMVLKISEENDSLEKDFTEYFYQFIKGLSLCAQNAVHSDRQFTQSLDFDIRIYNTPPRLNAFYNAYIYFMKKFLNKTRETSDKKNNYEFLSYLGVTDNVQVYELFKNMSEQNRLFLVNIPENQAYDVKLMMIILGHEVGHFVGQPIRCREERYLYAIEIVARIVTVYFKCNLKREERFWKLFEEKVKKKITENMRKFENINDLKMNSKMPFDSDELNKILKLSQKYKYYTHIMRYSLEESVLHCLSKDKEELFGYLLEREYLDGLERDEKEAEEKRKKLDSLINQYFLYLTGHSVWTGKSFSITGGIHLMITYFKECEADLVAILTLRLSMEDYLYAIWKSIEDKLHKEEFIPDELIIRGALVTYCMICSEDGEFCWNNDELAKIDNSGNDAIKKLMIGIINYGQEHNLKADRKDKSTGMLEPVEIINSIDVFNDEKIAHLILNYLKDCKKAFFVLFNNELSKEQSDLINIYQLAQENGVEKQIEKIQECIEKYKKILQKEIKDTVLEKTRKGV